MSIMPKKQPGFTIVELLIVIVVIGILAAITIVAFNGVQNRARDAQRKSDLSNIAKAMQIYTLDNGGFMTTGGGAGDGSGWFNAGNPTILKTLTDAGHLSANVTDPKCGGSTSGSCPGYLFEHCVINGVATGFIFVKLESEPFVAAPADMTGCGSAKSWWDSFKSNYYIRISA